MHEANDKIPIPGFKEAISETSKVRAIQREEEEEKNMDTDLADI